MSSKPTKWQEGVINNYPKVHKILVGLDDEVLQTVIEVANDYLKGRKEGFNSKIAKTEQQYLVKGSFYLDGEIEF